MNNTELDQQFRSEAADAPDSGAVRDAVIRGVALRGRRRRRVALVSSVMAVVLAVGGIGVASRIGQAAPHPAAPAWPVDRPVQIPAGSTAVPFTTSLPATSPITATVDAPADSDTIVWSFDVSTLQVAWTNPNAAGVSTEVPPSGASATPAELIQRGYLISATAGLTVSSVAADGTERDRLAPLTAPREVMVAGHRATIGGDPDPTQSRSFFGPVARWLVWQLPDGRYLHAWARAGGDDALMAFGAGLVDRPTVLARRMLVGATLPGYTVEGFTQLGTATDLDGASVVLCPAGTTSTSGVVTPPCLTVNVGPTRTLRANPTDKIKSITVDGLTTRIDKSNYESTADLGHGFSAVLSNGLPQEPADLDIATLEASIRLDPSAALGHSPYIEPPAAPASANASSSADHNPPGLVPGPVTHGNPAATSSTPGDGH